MLDFIIIGQGIAGSLLAFQLIQEGQSVLVIDEHKPNSASRIAAGVINPVSGRRFTMAWQYDTFYPAAVNTYRRMEQLLGLPLLKERDIWTVLPSEQLRDAFMARTTEGPAQKYTRQPSAAEVERYAQWLHQPYGAAAVRGATVLLHKLLPAWRAWLLQKQYLRHERLEPGQLQVSGAGVRYGNLAARRLIFCEGAQITANPWFGAIPFLLNKGETLLVRVPGFETEDIVKRSITLVPQEPETYWVGATFAWDYENEMPTAEKRAFLENGLQQLLKVPYQVLGQQAGIRPSGTDRRPIIGLHPACPALGVFNGLGTKGCSLAPAMAAHFASHLLKNTPLWPEVDARRFLVK